MKHLLLIFITMCFISCQQYNSKTGVLVLVNDSLHLSYKGQMYANEHMVLRSLQKQGKHVNDWLGDPTDINVKISKKSKHVIFLYVMGSAPIQAHTSAFAKLTHLEQLNFETTDIQSIGGLKGLTKLHEVNFYRCTQVEKEIIIPEAWKSIENLAFRGCLIKDIHFPKNSKIKRLRLDGNQLTFLNKTFNYLTHLEYLELDANPIREFDLSNLKKLKTISLSRTPISNIKLLRAKHPNVKIYFDDALKQVN